MTVPATTPTSIHLRPRRRHAKLPCWSAKSAKPHVRVCTARWFSSWRWATRPRHGPTIRES
jgi:hypothetical protein